MIRDLWQIGVNIMDLYEVSKTWFFTTPRETFVIHQSEKNEDLCVIETRHMEFAAMLIKNIPTAVVKRTECEERTVRL